MGKHSVLKWNFLNKVGKKFYDIEPGDLFYKHMTIVNDDSSIVIKWNFKRIYTGRGIIYDRHMFIVQATGGDRTIYFFNLMALLCG